MLILLINCFVGTCIYFKALSGYISIKQHVCIETAVTYLMYTVSTRWDGKKQHEDAGVEYQQGTGPSPQKAKQPDLEFSLYGDMYPFLGHASIFNFHCSVNYNGCVKKCVVHNFPFGYSAMIIISVIQNLQLKLLPTLMETKKV